MRTDYRFVKIYTLTDYNNRPFYVGCTVHELESRLKGHLYEARFDRTHCNILKNQKIRSLDFEVMIKALFIVPADKGYYFRRTAMKAETVWINKMLSEGYELCNSEKERNRFRSCCG